MTKLSLVLVAAVSFAAFGCKQKASDCGKAIGNTLEVAKADLAKTPGVDDKVLQKLRDLGVQHCQDDKWSDEAIQCMVNAKTELEDNCYGKLTAEQRNKMNKASMEIMTPPGGNAGAGGAGAGAGAGSAASSAGARGDRGSAGSAAAGGAPSGNVLAGSSDSAAGRAAAPK